MKTNVPVLVSHHILTIWSYSFRVVWLLQYLQYFYALYFSFFLYTPVFFFCLMFDLLFVFSLKSNCDIGLLLAAAEWSFRQSSVIATWATFYSIFSLQNSVLNQLYRTDIHENVWFFPLQGNDLSGYSCVFPPTAISTVLLQHSWLL